MEIKSNVKPKHAVRGPDGRFHSTNPNHHAGKRKSGDTQPAKAPSVGGKVGGSTGQGNAPAGEAVKRGPGRPRKLPVNDAGEVRANPTDIDPSLDPGFPTGSTDQLAADIAASEVEDTPPFTIAQPAEKKKIGRPKGSTAAAIEAAAKMTDEEAVTLVAIVMEMLNGAIGVVAPFAKMYPEEQSLIQAPLARIIGRMSPSAQEFMQTWADPVTVVTGLALWAMRVRHDIVSAQAVAPKPIQPTPQAQTVPTEQPKPKGPELPTPPDEISRAMGSSII